jgi:NAD(P)-dependent dehydrogenase (short-subunit alcohol dehydrogenase family)
MSGVSFDFDGETVVVTGGSSGIGRAMALAFAAAGATVLIADIKDASPGSEDVPTHEAITDAGGTAAFVRTDVSEPDEIAAVVEAAREYGGVDVMVNNAGVIDRNGLLEATAADYDRVGDINARAVLLGCRYAGVDMVEREDPGVILNTASVSSEFALYDHICYDAAKGAVRMITRTAALELAEYGIRVNAVAPGFVATPLSAGGPESLRESVADDETVKPVPMGRAAETEEVAEPALFLCSEAASYVTGESFFVDGGYSVL